MSLTEEDTTLSTKQVRLSDKTYDELTELGKKRETYDEIIWKLIQSYKKVNKL